MNFKVAFEIGGYINTDLVDFNTPSVCSEINVLQELRMKQRER